MEHPFILLVLSRHDWTRSRHQLWIVYPFTIPAKSAARHGTHGNGSHAIRNCGKRGSLCRHHGYHRALRLDYHRNSIPGCNGSLCCLDRAHSSDHLFVLHPGSSRLFQKAVDPQKIKSCTVRFQEQEVGAGIQPMGALRDESSPSSSHCSYFTPRRNQCSGRAYAYGTAGQWLQIR